MTQTSWVWTEYPTDPHELKLIETRKRSDPLLTGQHASEVLDDNHPGVMAVADGDPEGWKITLQHVLATSSDFANSGCGVAKVGEWAYRGESKEFPTMRTSLERWAHPRTVVTPPRPLEAQDLVVWQTGIMAVLFGRGFGPVVEESRLRQELFNMWPEHHALTVDPDIRQMMFQLQHYGGPTLWLDWTWDVLVALYFACRDDQDCDHGRVWFRKVNNLSFPTPGIVDLLKQFSYLWVLADQHDPSDQRLQAQSSLFLFLEHGGVVWRADQRGEVCGVTIPKEHKKPILEELCRRGVTASSLFPPMSTEFAIPASLFEKADVGVYVSSSD